MILQILRAVERENVTREIKIIQAFFLVQKMNWASGPISKRAFYLGHRVLPVGIAILTSQAGQEFSNNSMEDNVLSSSCRNSLRSTKPVGVVVGGMSKNWG